MRQRELNVVIHELINGMDEVNESDFVKPAKRCHIK
jgi:hypothetical protein